MFGTQRKRVMVGIGLVLAGAVAGYGAAVLLRGEEAFQGAKELRATGNLTNPLLECESAAVNYQELRPFRYKVEEYLEKSKGERAITDAAVYFRDLNNGPWFGINERSQFSPASLLKVPVMIAYLRYANGEPSILGAKLRVEETTVDEMQNFVPAAKAEAGKEYTVNELIERMISSSDNAATETLLRHIDQGFLNRTFTDLGMIVPEKRALEDFMNVKEYASFFRILFNASYSSKTNSERALEYLTRSEFQEGIVAGVPYGITIAHKFGERTLTGGVKQLHDCGIVYYPERPYVLCVMTRGNDFSRLAGAVKDISRLVYQNVEEGQLQ